MDIKIGPVLKNSGSKLGFKIEAGTGTMTQQKEILNKYRDMFKYIIQSDDHKVEIAENHYYR